MTTVTIHPVAETDHAQWLTLWEGYNHFYDRVIAPEVTQATWLRFFDRAEPVHALIARADGRIAGLVHYIFHRNTSMLGPICYLQDLFTSPEARGLGVGRSLIKAVYGKAAGAGSPRVYWLTHETNSRAIALYNTIAERSGFVQYRKDTAGN